jgi:hypothetical protein
LGFVGFVFGPALDPEHPEGPQWSFHEVESSTNFPTGLCVDYVVLDIIVPDNEKESDLLAFVMLENPTNKLQSRLDALERLKICKNTDSVPNVVLRAGSSVFGSLQLEDRKMPINTVAIPAYKNSKYRDQNIEDILQNIKESNPDFNLKKRIKELADKDRMPSDYLFIIKLPTSKNGIIVNFGDLIREIVDLQTKLVTDTTSIDETFQLLCSASNDEQFQKYLDTYLAIIKAHENSLETMTRAHFINPEVSNICRLLAEQTSSSSN